MSLLTKRRTALMAGIMAVAITATSFGNLPSSISSAHAAEPVQSASAFSFAPIVEKVQPAVVSIRVKKKLPTNQIRRGQNFRDFVPRGHPLDKFFERFERLPGYKAPNRKRRNYGSAQGSGFFISADGYVVTNHHVIRNAQEVRVLMQNGESYKAKIIGSDKKTDLALLKVEKKGKDFKFVEFGKSNVRVGDWVVAVGNPFGLGGTVTAGIVSARGRDIGAGPYDDFIQIDAAVNKGNSGGPAFDLTGKVIGVNTAIYSPSGGNVGIAFAIPSEVVQSVIEDLKDDGKVTRGYLGVSIQKVNEDIAQSLGLAKASGALVRDVFSLSPADKAGIRSQDVILKVDGQTIADPKDLSRKIAGIAPGKAAKLEVWRNGKSEMVSVKIGKLSDAKRRPTVRNDDSGAVTLEQWGLAVGPRENGRKGAQIFNVEPGSIAERKRLKPGDVILEVNGVRISTAEDAEAAMLNAREAGRKAVLLRIKRGNRSEFVALPFARN